MVVIGEISSGTLQPLYEFLDELEGAQDLYAPACEKNHRAWNGNHYMSELLDVVNSDTIIITRSICRNYKLPITGIYAL